MLLLAFLALVAPSIVLCAYMEPPPWSIHRASDYQDTTRPTQELGLETFLKYDTSLLQERFKGDHKKAKKWIREVVGIATKILLQLDIPVRLTPVGDIEYIKEKLSPDHQTLKRLSGLRRKKLTSYFCGNETGGNLGLAYFHSACNNLGAALNVNAYSVVSGDDVTISGRTLAQQLGHNMGMGLDSDIPCEKPWGYMDPTINGESSWKGFWTNCSNREFENYYMEGIGACLKENGNLIGADEDEDSLYPTYDQPTTKESLQSTTNDNDNDDNSGNGDNDNKDGNDQKDDDSSDNKDGNNEKDNDSGDDKDCNDEKDGDSVDISEYQQYSEEYDDEKDTDSMNNDNDNNSGNDYTDSGNDYNDSGNDYNDSKDGNDEKYHDSGDLKDDNDEKDDDSSDNKDGSDEKDDDILSDLLDGDSNDNKDANDEKDDDSGYTKDVNDEKNDETNITKDGNGTKDNDSDDNKDGNDKKDSDSNVNKDANDEEDDDSNETKNGDGTKDDDSDDNKNGNDSKTNDSNDNKDGKDEKDDDYDDNTDGNNENDNDHDDNEDGNDIKDDDSVEISKYKSGEDCDGYFGCNYSEEYQSGDEYEINEDGYYNDDEDELNGNYYEDVIVSSEQIKLVVGRGCNTGFPFWLPCIFFG